MKIYSTFIICFISFSIIIAQDTTLYPAGNKFSPKIPEQTELLDTTFSEVTTANLTGISHGSAIWGDYDNDGDLDILISGLTESSGQVTKIYRNDDNDIFTEQTSISFAGLSWGGTAWGDYDNDGDLDILLTGEDETTRHSKIYNNNGDNSFTEQTSILLSGVYRSSVAWGDYDNDGDLDVLLAGLTQTASNGVAKIYMNEGNNTFLEQSSISLLGVGNCSAAWGDYDNDGDLDILLTGFAAGAFSKIYRNEGNNSFIEQSSIPLTDVGDGSVAWGDYDNDGDLDIVLSGWTGSERVSNIYRNEGNNSFVEQSSISLTGVSGSRGKSAAWGDYDNDGDLDLIICGDAGGYYSAIYRNNADNSFTEMTDINLMQVYNCSAAWGDYDNDGDLDLIITGSTTGSSRNTRIYKNNSLVANTIPTTPSNLIANSDTTTVTLGWSKSTDNETPQDGLKYNIVIGTAPGAEDIVSPMSDRSTGCRKVIDMGNTNHNNSWTIKNLAPGIYYWSVQAIDNNFTGSDFSTEQSFTLPITTNTATWLNQISIEDAGGTEASQALTFGQHIDGTDSLDLSLGEYELPPPPPTSIFDGRFNLPTSPQVSSLIDYRDSTEKEIIWNMSFQPGLAGYPMIFTWDSTSFPEGTFYLRDLFNGSFVFVNMKEQSSYILTEIGMTSLNISYRGNCSPVSVNNGWNIISAPLLAEDMSLVNLFPNSTSLAYGYDNGYGSADTLVGGKGYWLKFDADEEIQICGLLQGDTVSVQEGWNMLGVYENDLPVNQLTTTPPGIIATFLFGYNDGYYIADTLKSGQGFWARVTDDGVINLNGGTTTKEEERQSLAKLGKDWGRIKITDSESKSATLYATEEEIDLNLFELPPMPPSGIFDARYGSGRLVEDLSHKKIIQISSDNYPLTIIAEGINITVKDRINGEVLNEVISDGEEIRIMNNKITSFIVTGKVTGEMPLAYELYQNYPNPFNPNTTIKFAIPQDSDVNITVYDILGEKIAELIDKEMKAGYHQVKFDASQFASGVYLYRIKANDFITTKKMILMK